MPPTPSADFCRPVRIDCSTLSPESRTNGRSPEVSSAAFRTQPPDLQPVPLMDMDFMGTSPLVRHRMPRIWFLYIGSYVCSTLLSDPASRRRPCASLSLHLHQVVKRTFTFELSNMLGTLAVGTNIADRPPHRSVRARSRIRLLPWMPSGEACLRIGVQNSRERNPALQQRIQPLPRLLATLTATIQNSSPQSA